MAKKVNDDPLVALKKSVDMLILIELVKSGAKRDQIRKVIGSVDNNTISAVKAAVGGGSSKAVRGDNPEAEV